MFKVIAFAWNAKSFAIAILFFFLFFFHYYFFLLVTFSGQVGKSFFAEEQLYCYPWHVWPRLDLFFVFFYFSTWFWTDFLKLFSKRFIINYQGSVWPRSDSFLGHTKKSFRKKYSSSCYWRRVCHMRRLKHGNKHSQHPKKHKKQPEARNKLASQWMAEHSRVKTERNRVDK